MCVLVYAALSMGVIACVDTDPSAGSGGTSCDTDPPMTSGGDWGDPYPSNADSSTGQEVVYDPPPVTAPDPTAWEYDPVTKTYYRAPTRKELDDNGWADATLLVIPPSAVTGALSSGVGSVMIDIPMAEYPGYEQRRLDFESVLLSRMQTHSSLSFGMVTIDARGRVTTSSITPKLHFYLPKGISWQDFGNVAVRVFASDRGGVELNGARRNDRTFRLHGPYDAASGPYTLDIALPRELGSDLYFLMRTGFSAPEVGALELGPRMAGDIAGLEVGTDWSPDSCKRGPIPWPVGPSRRSAKTAWTMMRTGSPTGVTGSAFLMPTSAETTSTTPSSTSRRRTSPSSGMARSA